MQNSDVRFSFLALLVAAAIACGASSESEPGSVEPVGDDDGTTSRPAVDGGVALPSAACIDEARVAAFVACIDGGKAPRACLADHPTDLATCDADEDGLDDGLEDALMKSYSPVFAFNDGTGGTTGDPETRWPANATHYATHSRLMYGPEGEEGKLLEIAKAPKLDDLAGAVSPAASDGGVARADDPRPGAGPNFWLCLEKNGETYPDQAVVSSLEASRALADGVDAYAVVHPTHPRGSNYAFVGTMIFFAYNLYNADNHEGDWEGGGVFVDLDRGDVVAIYTDRHPSSDDERLTPLVGEGAAEAKDPGVDPPKYNVCQASDVPRGVRFSDFDGIRHHPIFYVSTGGHAIYAYPGATRIKGVSCTEGAMIRDTHNGEHAKLFLGAGGYGKSFHPDALQPISHGVRFQNLGERDRLRVPWTAFAGQWGCQLQSFAKAYPGPWDNGRLCRHYFTQSWGKAPPFIPIGDRPCDPEGK